MERKSGERKDNHNKAKKEEKRKKISVFDTVDRDNKKKPALKLLRII